MSPTPEGGLGLVTNKQKGRHLVAINNVAQVRLKAGLRVHITIASGLFVLAGASTGVLALVPWGVRGLYEAPVTEHEVCPPTMSAEPRRAIKLLIPAL